MRSTVLPDHKDPKQAITVESEKLDFSFTNLEDIESLKMKEPRAGKRKAIIEPTDEEEDKKQQEQLAELQAEEEAKIEEQQQN